jgi:hypothetical protein
VPQPQPAPLPGYGSPSAHGSAPPAYGAPAPYAAPHYSPPQYAPPPPVPEPSLQRGPSRPPSAGLGRDPDSVEASAPRVLAGFLVSYDGLEFGGFWPIYQGQNQLGRRGAAPGLDIEIDHPTTSSRHAVLYASARPARLKLEDAGSTNGTFLGEQQLERGHRVEVQDGDSIRFGGFATIVKLV